MSSMSPRTRPCPPLPTFRGTLSLFRLLAVVAFLRSAAIAQTYETIDGHPCFRSLKGMTDSLFDLVAKYPALASISVIGQSYLKATNSNSDDYPLPQNGYDIYALNVTASRGDVPSAEKGKVLIISGVHAREYAPPELTMRFVEMLVEGYGTDADVTSLLKRTEVHFVIHVNPDGRYVAENYPDLRWRKNMNPSQSGGCDSDEIGVDLNRQYDFMWSDKDGSSSDPCSNTYHGRAAHSEPEAFAVMSYARSLFPEGQRRDDAESMMNVPVGEDTTGVFIDVHSSGEYIYYPWHHRDASSPDDDALQAFGRKMTYYNDYRLWAPNYDFVYGAAGAGADYMYAVLGTAALGFELGNEFYEDCGDFEDTIVPDNLPALLYAVSVSRKPFSLVKGPDVISLDVVPEQDGPIRVRVEASDDLLVNANDRYPSHSTGFQGVAGVRLYMDVHPDDYGEGDSAWDMQPAELFDARTFELEITSTGIPSGLHTLYAQATDGSGYLGPVSSEFFQVERQATAGPTFAPTDQPTPAPSKDPTATPTTANPTTSPSGSPTRSPSEAPSKAPTIAPVTAEPTVSPTPDPTTAPSHSPSTSPSKAPTDSPSQAPTTAAPTREPSASPTANPTMSPSGSPTFSPSRIPSQEPSWQPSSEPSLEPSMGPSAESSGNPSIEPSQQPSLDPTNVPSVPPTENPTSSLDPTTSPIVDVPLDVSNAESASNASNTARLSVAAMVLSFSFLFL